MDRFDQMLEQLQFDHYPELKSAQHEELEDYPTFLSVLRQIKELRFLLRATKMVGSPIARLERVSRARS